MAPPSDDAASFRRYNFWQWQFLAVDQNQPGIRDMAAEKEDAPSQDNVIKSSL